MPTDKQIITASTSVSGTVTVPMQSFEYALVHLKVAPGGDFDVAVSTTPTGISGDSAVSVIPSGTDVTDISDIMLEVGPTGADSITVAWSNLSNNSVSPHTITAATGYVDGQNVNTNSTLTTDAGPRTGTLTRTVTGLNCAPGAVMDSITCASEFHAGDTGKTLTVANSDDAGNDGAYTLTYVSGTSATVVPDFASPDDQTTTPALTATISDTLVGPVLAPGADLDRLTAAASSFHVGDTGRSVVVANSILGLNDGTYTMTHVSDTAVDVGVPFVVPDTQVITPALTAIITMTVTAADLAPGAVMDRLHSTNPLFAAGDVGRTITVTGSSDPGNDGVYTISAYVDVNNVTVTPDFAATDAGGGTLAVVMTFPLTTVALAPGAVLSKLNATGEFAAGDVGRTATVSGATYAANNGAYTITAFIDADNVTVTPDFTLPETGGTLAVSVSVALGTVALAPGTDYTKVTSGSDMFSQYDVGRSLVIAAGANAGTYTVDTFTSATEIDVVETFPAITTGTAGTVTGTITGIDTAPGGDVDRVHTATAQFAEVDEGATLSITGSTWELNGYMRLWSEGKK